MDWVHVFVGVLAGLTYSILGWLKNRAEYMEDDLDPREVAQKLIDAKEDPEKIGEIAEKVGRIMGEAVRRRRLHLDFGELLATVAQGLAVGLVMGLLGLPLDASVSLLAQVGLLTTLRKIFKVIGHAVAR